MKRHALLLLLAAFPAAGAPPKAGRPPMNPMPDCTKSIKPGAKLADEVKALAPGGVLCLEPGTYDANLVIDKPMTLRGLGPPELIILDGGGRTSVLKIAGQKPAVTIELLTLKNGSNRDGGGGIASPGFADLTLRDLVIRDCRADGFGGGAIFLAGGETTMERMRVTGNAGPLGAAMIFDGLARVFMKDSVVVENRGKSSAIYVHDAAEVHLRHVTVAGNETGAVVEVRGIPVRTPTVTIEDSIISGKTTVANGPKQPGKVVAARTLFDGVSSGAMVEGGANRFGDPLFAGTPPEPYHVKQGSPAIGLAAKGHTAGALKPGP